MLVRYKKCINCIFVADDLSEIAEIVKSKDYSATAVAHLVCTTFEIYLSNTL